MSTLPDDITITRARDADLPEMARLHYASYPGAPMTLEQRIAYLRDDPRLSLEDHWVCWKRDAIVGIFALYNFNVMRGGKIIPMGGIGGVAVAPEARRDRIAYWMMARAVEIMDQNGMPLSLLYPFRHNFYRKLGWGLIGKVKLFRMSPESLPVYPERTGVKPVMTSEGQEEVMACYNRYAKETDGLLLRDDPIWHERVFKNSLCYAYHNPDNNQIDGYLTYRYRPYPPEEQFVSTDMLIQDFVFVNDQAMRGLLGFLSTQRDQVAIIELPYQGDLPLEQILSEPMMPGGKRSWSIGAETAWVGSWLMGRVVQLRRAMAAGGFGQGEAIVTLNLSDDVSRKNCESLTLEFSDGVVNFLKSSRTGLILSTDIATFSSIYWGAMQLKDAVSFGLATVDGEGSIDELNAIFNVSPPVCLDQF